jgi:hypothetical protein
MLSQFTGNTQNSFRYSGGVLFNFGGERPSPPPVAPPPPPAMKPCPGGSSVLVDQDCPKQDFSLRINASPSEVCPGALSKVAPAGSLPEGASMEWALNGEPISRAPALEFGSTGRDPGTYKVDLKVTAAGYNDESANTIVTVRPYGPPSGSLSASPTEIWVGEKANLEPSFRPGDCGGSLGPVTFSVPEGSISGTQYDSSGVRFDPADPSEQRKTIQIVAQVSDGRSSGTAQTAVVVKQKGAIAAKRLPDILFPSGSDRVNNCGKRVLLEELKSMLDSDPTGKVVLVGHIAENESAGLDLKRVLNAAAVISAGQGICSSFPASQILTNSVGAADNGIDFQPYFCGASTGTTEKQGQAVAQSDDSAKYRRVEVWFVPTGGALPASAKDAKNAATLSLSHLGCPK